MHCVLSHLLHLRGFELTRFRESTERNCIRADESRISRLDRDSELEINDQLVTKDGE
jgi:hypothetical protein